jgi:hypothetical protein
MPIENLCCRTVTCHLAILLALLYTKRREKRTTTTLLSSGLSLSLLHQCATLSTLSLRHVHCAQFIHTEWFFQAPEEWEGSKPPQSTPTLEKIQLQGAKTTV